MDHSVADLLAQALTPLVSLVATGLGAWLFSLLPGPAKTYMASATHARDVGLLMEAMQHRAAAQVSPEVKTGQGPEDIIAYVKAELPDLVKKLQVSDQALQTAAGATVLKAQAELAPVVAQ